MPKRPVLSGRDVMRSPERLGFQRISQRGSHVKLRRNATTIIVPDHREIRKGTLAAIVQQAGVTLPELLSAISH